MLDSKFVGLLITFVWMSGLFAIVLTVANIQQERRSHRQEPGYTWGRPRLLLPLYGALALFCLGLAMQAYAAQRPSSLWITIVWELIAASFAARALSVLLIGFRQGWNVRLNGRLNNLDSANLAPGMRISVWLIFTALLLLINVYFLTTLGIARVNAGQLFGVGNEENSAATSSSNTESEDGSEVASSTERLAESTVSVEAAVEGQPTPSVIADSVTPDSVPPVSVNADEVEVDATATPVAVATAEPTTRSATGPIARPTGRPTARPMVAPQGRPTVMLQAAPNSTPAETPAETTAATNQTPIVSAVVQSARGANVRLAPNLAAEIVTVLDPATVVPLLGRSRDNEWFLVQLADGERGWISSTVVTPSRLVDGLPILDEE